MGLKRHVGLIGGGQLALLLLKAAKPFDLHVTVLDPDSNCPAKDLANELVTASFDDAQALAHLAESCDLITLEIEAPPAGLLARMENEGRTVYPGSFTLGHIQDKLEQRRFFRKAGLAQPAFAAVDHDLDSAARATGMPAMLKSRRAGYDGRGVRRLSSIDGSSVEPGAYLLEHCVDIQAELAVIVVRGIQGQALAYEVTELIMDPERHVLDLLVAPARVKPSVAKEAQRLALAAVECLNGVGAFGVELFLDRHDQLLLNEVSPRVHNSGHHTLEACATSQFANHWRAVLGLDLGPVDSRSPAAMANLLGPEGLVGPYQVQGLELARAIPDVYVHLYQKVESRPGRKMGHVTALADNVENALAKVAEARKLIRFVEVAWSRQA